jgi:capsular polysaccharide biosynthesis protein
MDFENNEFKLGVNDLIVNVLLKWRYILLIAILVVGILGLKQYIQISTVSQEKYNQAQIDYEIELNEHNDKLASDQVMIDKKTEAIKNQQEYNSESILMNIDPYNAPTGTLVFYVDSDSKAYTDILLDNYSSDIASAYAAYLSQASVYVTLLDNLNNQTELKYIQEAISVQVDPNAPIVKIQVNQTDQESCEKILTELWNLLEERKNELKYLMGEHEIVKLDESVYLTVNNGFLGHQRNNTALLESLKIELINLNGTLAVDTNEALPLFVYDMKLKMKNIVLGFGFGLVLGVMYFSIVAFMSSRLRSVKALKYRYGIMIIGEFNKKRKSIIDKWLLKKFNWIKDNSSDDDKIYRVYNNIEETIKKSNVSEGTNLNQSVLVIGSSLTSSAEDFKKQFIESSKQVNLDFVIGNDIINNKQVGELLSQYQYVILIEQFRESKFDNIEKEIELLKRYHNTLLGCIVLDI